MMRSRWTRVLPQAAGFAGAILLSGALALGQDPAQAIGARGDGQIEMDVVQALDSSNALKQDLITAATVKGEVTLAGTVTSEASKELAGAIVSRVAGVTAVHNNLKVGAVQESETVPAPADPLPVASEPAQAAQEETAQPLPQSYPQPSAEAAQPNPAAAQEPEQAASVQPYETPTPAQPPVRRPYNPNGAAQPGPQQALRPLTVAPGTLLQLRTSEALSSKRAQPGQPVQFQVIQDVMTGGVLAIPRGATVRGEVTDVKKAGSLSGSNELALHLTSLDLGGRSYPLMSDEFHVKGPDKTGQTVGGALTGGLIGTIIGCAAGHGAGCAIGAGAGVAAGTAASAASDGGAAWIPSEARVDFHLTAPVTVAPVSQEEVWRLAQGLYPAGGPTLYRRGDGPGYPPPPPGVVYAPYPPVYYHPYYVVEGHYYWR
jgi:hypothetical protein